MREGTVLLPEPTVKQSYPAAAAAANESINQTLEKNWNKLLFSEMVDGICVL